MQLEPIQKITVKFPRHYKNWEIITAAGESFLKTQGYVGFLVPALVDDFDSYPKIPEDVMNRMINHILLSIRLEDLTKNGKSTIDDITPLSEHEKKVEANLLRRLNKLP